MPLDSEGPAALATGSHLAHLSTVSGRWCGRYGVGAGGHGPAGRWVLGMGVAPALARRGLRARPVLVHRTWTVRRTLPGGAERSHRRSVVAARRDARHPHWHQLLPAEGKGDHARSDRKQARRRLRTTGELPHPRSTAERPRDAPFHREGHLHVLTVTAVGPRVGTGRPCPNGAGRC